MVAIFNALSRSFINSMISAVIHSGLFLPNFHALLSDTQGPFIYQVEVRWDDHPKMENATILIVITNLVLTINTVCTFYHPEPRHNRPTRSAVQTVHKGSNLQLYKVHPSSFELYHRLDQVILGIYTINGWQFGKGEGLEVGGTMYLAGKLEGSHFPFCCYFDI